jgi:Xaa-Pro aminopeptidase
VSGTFTEPQRRVYEVVLAAQLAAIAKCRPGVPFDEVHEASLEVLIDGMLELGLCKGTREEILESGAYRQWYMHRTSHWLGLDVHDCGGYDDANGSRPLEPGMVLTVEPGLYIAPDAEGAPEDLRGIGVRIEDDILITADGHENLTAAVPKTLDEVEAACRA